MPRSRLSRLIALVFLFIVTELTAKAQRLVQYWDLPTGSHIAYLHYAATPPVKATPIIFLHGGPGAYIVDHSVSIEGFYTSLAKLGFDVYLYDQIGSGHSARLDDPRQYTVDRHIQDLEAIRRVIGVPRLILIGDSWGATLAANYMAAHPGRCAKAIFSGPGAIDNHKLRAVTYPDAPMSQAAESWFASIYRERYPSLQDLIRRDPVAAYREAPDKIMDPQFDDLIQRALPFLVCDPSKLPKDLSVKGMGWWVNAMIALDLNRQNRRALRTLSRDRTPVLILRGGCDYLHWDVAYQYKQTFPNSTLLYAAAAGHAFGFDEPELYSGAIRAFLLGQPLPSKPYTSSAPPPRVMPNGVSSSGQ